MDYYNIHKMDENMKGNLNMENFMDMEKSVLMIKFFQLGSIIVICMKNFNSL